MRPEFFEKFPELAPDMMVVDQRATDACSSTPAVPSIPALQSPDMMSGYGRFGADLPNMTDEEFAGAMGMPDNWMGDMLLSS